MIFVRQTVLVLWIAILTGCATGFDPKPIESVPFRERTVSQAEDGVRVSTAVPSAKARLDAIHANLGFGS